MTRSEELREHIDLLVRERQRLRASSASHASLERNRLQLADSQRELSHALVEQHLPADVKKELEVAGEEDGCPARMPATAQALAFATSR